MRRPKPIQIGVTGGIGSGKSVVCKIFRTLGIPIYDADQAARKLMENDSKVIESIVKLFGKEAYLKSGLLNREYIAQQIFSNKELLNSLNSIVHPAVGEDYKRWYSKQNSPYVIKEAALLIESGSYKSLDKLINVLAPMDVRIERIEVRDPFRSTKEIEGIISKQLSDQQRKELAHFNIDNSPDVSLLDQVIVLDRQFRGDAHITQAS